MSIHPFAVLSVRSTVASVVAESRSLPIATWATEPTAKMGRWRREGGRC